MSNRCYARFVVSGALVLTLWIVVAGCGGGGGGSQEQGKDARQQGTQELATGSYVGEVAGTNAFVSVVVDQQKQSLSYVSDGQQIAEWFEGPLSEEGQIDLSNDAGAHLYAWANQEQEAAEGIVTLPNGEEYSFTTEPAEEDEAGLYRAQETIDGDEYVGGWIVLNSGEQRGAITRKGSGAIEEDNLLTRPSQPM